MTNTNTVLTIDSIKLSEKQKQQLIRLKSKTGIDNWNILCRWALCLSLAEKSAPPFEDIYSDSNVEMSWKVFAGEYADIYMALLRQAYERQRGQFNNLLFNDFFKLHLSRGITFFVKSKQLSNR